MSFLRQHSYYPTWIAGSYAVGRDALCHHTSSTYHRPCSYRHTLQYDTMGTYPYIILDSYRSRFYILSIHARRRQRVVTDTIIHLMTVRVDDKHTCTDIHVIAYRQTVMNPHPCAAHPHVVTYQNPCIGTVCEYRATQVATNRIDGIAR